MIKRIFTCVAVCTFCLLAFGSVTQADINDARITEVYVGISGADGTQDWIEVTNTGTTPIDTSELFYDDVSADILEAGQLDSFILGPGESAIFLEEADAVNEVKFGSSVEEFLGIWGPTLNVGLTNGGGGLGGGGDAANIMDSSGKVIDTLEYDASLAGGLFTIENNGNGLRQSVAGENGAFESNPFEDQPGNFVTLIGSPTPASTMTEFFEPSELNVFRGITLEGDLASTLGSDNIYLKLNPGFTISNVEDPVWLIFDGAISSDAPANFEIIVETSTGTPGLTKTIEMFDWNTNGFVVVDTRNGSFNTDEIVNLDLTDQAMEFISPGDANVRARIGWRATGFTINFPWVACVDQVNWMIGN